MAFVNPRYFEEVFRSAGDNKADGVKRVLAVLREGLDSGKFKPDQISLKGLGITLGLFEPYDLEGSFQQTCEGMQTINPNVVVESLWTESNPGLMTNAFAVATGELISRMVIEGYNDTTGFIGDDLVTTVPVKLRNSKMVGFTSLGGPLDVAEGHPYSETDFAEKWVSTKETKKGRILSLTEELILFDQTGQISLIARDIGKYLRQERERTIVRGVMDADSASGAYVYRPNGTGTALYATDGSNKNYIGAGGVTGFDAAVPLQDWTDLDTVLNYRATKVTDDRIDGDPQPIAGLNSKRNILLVPNKLNSTGKYVAGAIHVEKSTNTAEDTTRFNNPVEEFVGAVKSSPYVDAVSPADWFYGDFKSQFIWTEVYPVQTFVQGRDSESAFERDTALRVKTRYYGGLTAREKILVTKVDGV